MFACVCVCMTSLVVVSSPCQCRWTGSAGRCSPSTGMSNIAWQSGRQPTSPRVPLGLEVVRSGKPAVMDAERLWRDAEAIVQRDVDAQAREEAFEVFVAESARMRLVDRSGAVSLWLTCGAIVHGTLEDGFPIAEHLVLRGHVGDEIVVPSSAVVMLRGSLGALRPEDIPRMRERTVASWLRALWVEGAIIRILLSDGQRHSGTLGRVAADHVELIGTDESERFVIPFSSVQMWRTG